MNLTNKEIGYLAGFVDGEGSFIVNKREHIGYKGIRYVGYSYYLDIGNTNKQVLEWIKEKVGVSSAIYENPQKGNRKTAYRLRICYKQAKPLTKVIMDCLIIKRRNAEVFLLCDENPDKEALFNEMKMLNFRGIAKV